MSTAACVQLSIYDEEAFLEHGPLRPIGPEVGSLLLRLLALKGWTLHDPVRAFAGEGRLFILERDGLEVRRVGASLDDVAVELFEEAARFTPVEAE